VSSTHGKLLRYFFTAGMAAMVDIGGFTLLCLIRTPIVASAICSFCLAAIVNFLLSSRWVFHRAPSLRGFGLFFVAALGGLTVNVSVTLVGSLYLGLAPVLAKTVGVGTAFLLNFWLNLRVVFRTPAAGRNQ
jgi:putative flippase GtrA